MFPNKLAPKVTNNILKNPPYCSFVSFSIALVIPFNKTLESLRASTIFKILFVFWFEVLKAVIPEQHASKCS